ncbi:IS110 family transposase [Paenibacillus sp. OK003]|uniref:IS110 family transposase n=1 Tax=Paenibacillus sp. OK003 TaxID=1884380 RepID=UPI0008B57E8C|nr:IS110 family transposase [Paenibacillus sp. OK003]SEL27098.1 Transposase IS116/IS110/IS902 family protein [Paenibacillus sp. OK003]
MKPVVGVDVAKGKSVVQAFTKRNTPYGRNQEILHTPKGFEKLKQLLEDVEQKTTLKPVVILEPTGHYHRVLVLYLQQAGYEVILVNPLQAQRARRIGLRKVKTDASDAWHLGDLYYQEENWPAHPGRKEALIDLQFLSREHEFITSLYVQAKLNMRTLVDQIFPSYEGVFKDLYSKTSLNLLEACLTSEGVKAQTPEAWADMVRLATRASRSEAWMSRKVEALQIAIANNPVQRVPYGLEMALRSLLTLVREFQEQLAALEKVIMDLSETLDEVQLLKSIPGVGTKLATAVVSEIGDASQFHHPKQLVAYAGIDPSVFSSGKFVATQNKITKRGSKRLRRAMYLAVTCGLRRELNPRLREYYDKKKSEGKPHKVAVIACANKLLHHVYAMLKKRQPYTL